MKPRTNLGCVWFAFSFSENYFHFQNIRILKTCLVWLLIFCFQEIKTLKSVFEMKCIFRLTFSFYPKWGFWFQLKTRFYYFQFLVHLRKYFHWKWKQKSNQTYFHHHFLFSVKMKTKNSQTKYPLNFSMESVLCIFKHFLWV